jgi:predicted MFS family arabinose efflux permease
LACTIGIAITGVHFHVVGAMLGPLQKAYSWTRAEAAMAVTIYSLMTPLSNVAVGMLADRFGPRRVVLLGSLLFGVSYALFGLAGPALWTWYAATVLFAILGHGVSPVVWTMAVVRNFTAGRGLALAVALSGAGLMVAVVPTLVLTLVAQMGVRGAYFVMAAGGAILMFLPAFLFFKPQGEVGVTVAQRQQTASRLPGASVPQALRSRHFWQLGVGLAVVACTVGVFIVHFQSMLADAGLTPAEAASAALLMGPMMILGRLGTGYLFDRLPTALVAGLAFGIPVLACLLMLGFNGTLVMAMLCAGVIGLGMGAEVDVVAYVTSRYFGLRHYGVLFGILVGVYGAGIGIGSASAGMGVGRTGSYDPLLMALAIGCAAASALVATLGRPPELTSPSVSS